MKLTYDKSFFAHNFGALTMAECGSTKTWLIVVSVYASILTGAVIGYLLLAFLRRKVCKYIITLGFKIREVYFDK